MTRYRFYMLVVAIMAASLFAGFYTARACSFGENDGYYKSRSCPWGHFDCTDGLYCLQDVCWIRQ